MLLCDGTVGGCMQAHATAQLAVAGRPSCGLGPCALPFSSLGAAAAVRQWTCLAIHALHSHHHILALFYLPASLPALQACSTAPPRASAAGANRLPPTASRTAACTTARRSAARRATLCSSRRSTTRRLVRCCDSFDSSVRVGAAPCRRGGMLACCRSRCRCSPVRASVGCMEVTATGLLPAVHPLLVHSWPVPSPSAPPAGEWSARGSLAEAVRPRGCEYV